MSGRTRDLTTVRLTKVALSLRDRWRVEERRFECEWAWTGFGQVAVAKGWSSSGPLAPVFGGEG